MLISALAALAAFSQPTDALQEEPIQYRVGTMSEPDTFNPFSMTSGTSWTVAHMMYEFLYAVGPLMEPYPQLAEWHETSDNNKTWTYHLADDSTWHDGLPVTADDVVFTFKMIMRNPDDCALLGMYVDGFVDVVALDDYTVQITLEEAKATMLSLIVPILPEHIWSDIEDAGDISSVEMWDSEFFPEGPIGSGPFILEEYSKTSGFVRLNAQKPYHRLAGIDADSINIDELLFVIYSNDAAMTTALQTGEIDVVDGVPPLVWDTLIGDPDIEGQGPAALILEEFGFNCAPPSMRESVDENGHPNFPKASTNYETCNLSVRQAMTMATDISLITDEIHQGLAVAADSLIPTATPFWHYYVPEDERFEFDIAAANELLNNSGYNQFDGTDFGFAGVRENETSGVKLDFDFYYIRSIVADQMTAEKMQEWWEQIGVRVNLIAVSEGTLYNLWFNMEYDMFIWSWWPDVDPTFILSVLTTDEIPLSSNDITKWSDSFYSNPEYDALFIQQQQTMDLYERQAIVHEMQRIAYRDCPYICLVYPSNLIAYRTDRFMNFPDMVYYSGMTPSSFWYYFEIMPYDPDANNPPYNVDAGEDITVYVGDEQTLSGSAKDMESSSDELNWTWTIDELGVITMVYGQTVQYTFDVIGTHSIILSVKDPEGLSSSDTLTVIVNEIPEEGIGWISGYVNDTAGSPIEGAHLSIVGTSFSENTDEQGSYNISVVPGTYDIVASAEGYANETAQVIVEANVTTWQDFALEMTAGSVEGQVLDFATESPIANALVQLFLPGGESASYSKRTDVNGSFEIITVDQGTYVVVVSKTGYVTNETVEVTVTAGESESLVIYLTVEEEEKGGLSTTAIATMAVLAVVAVAAVAALLIKRRNSSRSKPPEGGAPPET